MMGPSSDLFRISIEGALTSVSFSFVVGMAVLSLTAATIVALLYRLIMNEAVPWHVPIIIGMGTVGLWMNTASTIVEFIERTTAQEPLLLQNMVTNSISMLMSGVAAIGGARFGDQLASIVRPVTDAGKVDTHMGKIVQSIGRYITVHLPDVAEIGDIEGYERVSGEVKAEIGDAELLFPRGLTLDQLHKRIVDRLRDDYGVGYVDVELDEEGSITHLAVGNRETGIGPTLPARRGAISIRTAPAPEATPGDKVQVWTNSENGAERVATAELRATGDTVATVVMDTKRIGAIDQSRTYDLVTLNMEKRPELEFVSLLRTANEAMESVTVVDGSPLAGLPVGGLRLPVIAIRSAAGTMHTAPPRDHVFDVEDTVYVIGRPDELRKFKIGADPEAHVQPSQRIDR